MKSLRPQPLGTDLFDDDDDSDMFVGQHVALFPKCGLPIPATTDGLTFYAEWCESLRSCGITVTDAMEASRRLQRHPPEEFYVGDHLPSLIRLCEIIRKDRHLAEQTATAPDRREERQREIHQLERDKANWDALSEADRESIRVRVQTEEPWSNDFRRFYQLLCLAIMRDDLQAGKIATVTDPTVIDGGMFGPVPESPATIPITSPVSPWNPNRQPLGRLLGNARVASRGPIPRRESGSAQPDSWDDDRPF